MENKKLKITLNRKNPAPLFPPPVRVCACGCACVSACESLYSTYPWVGLGGFALGRQDKAVVMDVGVGVGE